MNGYSVEGVAVVREDVNETKTLTSGNKLIIAMIALFDEGPESNRGGNDAQDAITEGGGAFPRGSADDNDAVVASDDSKSNGILIY